MLITILIEAVSIYLVFSCISKIKVAKSKIFFAIFLLSIIFFGIFTLIPWINIASVFASAIYILFLTLFSYEKLKNLHLSIFYSVFTHIIILLSASFANSAFYFTLGKFLDYMGRNFILSSIFLHISYAFFVFLFAFLISYKVGKMLHEQIDLMSDDSVKSVSPFLSIGSLITLLPFWAFTFFWESFFVEAISPLVNALSFIVFFILLAFAMITFIRSVRKEADFRINEESMGRLLDYIRYVENTSVAIRGFKHDNANLLLGFRDIIESNDIDGVRSYYQTYMESYQATIQQGESVVSIDLLNKVPNSPLKGLVSAKIQYASHLNINASIDIPNEIGSILDDNIVDLCRIIGNLFDNAIESCIEIPDSKLAFGIITLPTSIKFIFENTLPDPPPSIEKLYEEGFSTKGNNRGIGLYATSQILNRNDSLALETKFESGNLVQILTLHIQNFCLNT